VVRGVARSAQDRTRGAIIERIMCDMGVRLDGGPIAALAHEGGEGDFAAELHALRPFVHDGLLQIEGATLRVTERGRPFLRNIAAVFDTHHAALAAQAGEKARPRFSGAL
jgi:oxygen-independent coproporphyrinogen-3 oxidase